MARTAEVVRETKETQIRVWIDLDGTGRYDVATGIGFLDHMIEQFSRHSLIDVTLKVRGDLHVDQHHTTEDGHIGAGGTQAVGDPADGVQHHIADARQGLQAQQRQQPARYTMFMELTPRAANHPLDSILL